MPLIAEWLTLPDSTDLSRMDPPIRFSFGPRHSYFFSCDGVHIAWNTPPKFKREVLSNLGIPWNITLGPQPDEYCALFTDKKNEITRLYELPRSSHLRPMRQFLDQQNYLFSTSPSTTFAYSQEMGYIASTHRAISVSSEAFRYSALINLKRDGILHRRDVKHIGKQSDAPVHISLGKNAFFMKWQDGLCAWDLGQGYGRDAPYAALRKILGSRTSQEASLEMRFSVDFCALDAWNEERFFCVMEGGSRVSYALDEPVKAKIQPVIEAWQAERFGCVKCKARVMVKDDWGVLREEEGVYRLGTGSECAERLNKMEKAVFETDGFEDINLNRGEEEEEEEEEEETDWVDLDMDDLDSTEGDDPRKFAEDHWSFV